MPFTVAVYPVISYPPLAGALNATDTCPLPALATNPDGAKGTRPFVYFATKIVCPDEVDCAVNCSVLIIPPGPSPVTTEDTPFANADT